MKLIFKLFFSAISVREALDKWNSMRPRSYEVYFHLSDSRVYSHFCKVGIDKTFKKSALQKGIKALSEKTWEQINRTVIGYAEDKDIEKERKIRVDCTVVESNIHAPYDSKSRI